MLAEMVNAAVLSTFFLSFSCVLEGRGRELTKRLANIGVEGKTPMPVLALVAMQTTAIWDSLAQWKVPFPPLPGGATSKESKKAHSKVRSSRSFLSGFRADRVGCGNRCRRYRNLS